MAMAALTVAEESVSIRVTLGVRIFACHDELYSGINININPAQLEAPRIARAVPKKQRQLNSEESFIRINSTLKQLIFLASGQKVC
jgi:hypothetical protein